MFSVPFLWIMAGLQTFVGKNAPFKKIKKKFKKCFTHKKKSVLLHRQQ